MGAAPFPAPRSTLGHGRPPLSVRLSVRLAVLLSVLLAGCLHRTRVSELDLPPEAAFEAWAHEAGAERDYADFVAFLTEQGLADVVPPWHLWRQGTDWREVGEPAWAAPPRGDWPAITPTLRLLRDRVVPEVGPVVVVSAFRTPRFNERAGGAPGSRHKNFDAVDVVPKRLWSRARLHEALLRLWTLEGPALQLGLGLYGGTRFHVDCWKHRKW